MGFVRQVWLQLQAIYAGLSWPRRVAAAGAALLCMGLLAGVAFYGMQQDYRPLYSGLSPEDAGAVTGKLQARGVPFRLGAGGSSILVPTDQVAQLRLDLAVEGLPSKAKGFELFDEVNITATPFDQHVKYDRALQAELAKTISQVDPIVSARVHLVRPNQTPFIVEQKPATASVVLKLRPGTSLSRKTAVGITALVSRSVEGLVPDQVTLLDTNGRLLSAPTEGELAGPAASQFDHQREYEAYLSSRAEEMLKKVLGPGRAVVRVTAEMNFRHQKTKRETYDPDQKVLAKESVTSRKAKNGSGRAGGVAGTASNLAKAGGVIPAAATSAGNSEDEDTTESQYAVGKVEQEFEESGAPVKRLTIAAVVDLSRPEGEAGPALTTEEVEEIIKQATGYMKGRDEIKVNDRKLAIEPAPDLPDPAALDTDRWGWYMVLARNISLAGIVIVGITFAVMYARRSPLGNKAAEAAARPTDATTRFVELAQENPEALARLLAAWIDEPPAANGVGLARAA
jgi:flagellar M-ring protein FliF